MNNWFDRHRLSRREMFALLGTVAWIATVKAQTHASPFEVELAKAIAANDFANTGAYREQFVFFPGDPRRAQGGYRGHQSQRLVSNLARSLIVACEVTSEANYRSRLENPIWPGKESGVTIGIGYDLGYSDPTTFRSDWGDLLPKTSLEVLAKCCGLRGEAAALRIKELRVHRIGWPESNRQFDAYVPYVVGQTEGTFENCHRLPADSFGALVSLIYNRGASLSRHSDRRREMREIYDLMLKRDFPAVPAKIREMKRIWKDDPQARGLLERRELEALLFEQGLKG
ncbi:hypothetical protein D3C87_736860 [compost metagenome]